MKENQLRLGNLVYGLDEYASTALPVCSLNGDGTIRLLIFGESVGCFSASIINPIPITEEWLDMLGFNPVSPIRNVFEYVFNDLLITITLEEFNIEVQKNGRVVRIPAKCKYVHQLQNLYFALTGEEVSLVK